MSKELRSLDETLHNLVNLSDMLEYARGKFKGVASPDLLKSQEYLCASIDSLKKSLEVIKETQRKKNRENQVAHAQLVDHLDTWKKSEEEKAKMSYLPKLQLAEEQGLKEDAIENIRREYYRALQEIKAQYDDALNRGE
jgi:hypothetical protein